MHATRLSVKLKRYFFLGWLLEQPHGDVFMAHAMRQGNRDRLRQALPRYIQVHAILAGGLLVTLSRIWANAWPWGTEVLCDLLLAWELGQLFVMVCGLLAFHLEPLMD